MKKLSLFSGIGGIDLAAKWAGMETVAFCEREPFPQKVLKKHWPDVPIYDDVCTLTKERLEADGIDTTTIRIISAGYPCQPESFAGKRRGKEDDRWLWPEVRRLINEIRPRWFIGENVFGHVSLGLDTVLSDLEDDNYTAEAIIIPAAAIGAPHRRDRVIVLGYTECSGLAGQSWGGTKPQLENGYFGMESWIVADTQGERCGETGPDSGRSEEWATSGGDVGHSPSAGLSERGRSEREAGRTKERTGMDNQLERSSENVGNANGINVQGERAAWLRKLEERNRARKSQGRSHGGEKLRAAQSRLGGVLDGLSARLDGHRWPAGRGTAQHDWEPPRVRAGVKHRKGRLKAVGNAVVPAQIYPILAAIKQIDDLITKG